MKKKVFKICAYISTVLFFGFVALYAYVLIDNPNPKEINSSNGPDWRSISIGHGKITIAHSLQPSNDTNRPGMLTYPEDGGGNFHFTVAKYFSRNMGGCNLVFMNQNMPNEGFMTFVTPDDTITNRTSFHGFGMEFYSFKHTASLFGFSKDDRENEIRFIGYGIYFSNTSHTIDKVHNWWTLMISLWHPIILFGILPGIFVVKRLRCNARRQPMA